MKYLLTIFLTTTFFALTYSSAPKEFMSIDLGIISSLLFVALGLQIFLAHLVSRNAILQNFILSGSSLFNIIYVHLTLNQAFMSQPRYLQFTAILIGFFIVNTFMKMIDENPKIAKILPTLGFLATVFIWSGTVITAVPEPTQEVDEGMTSADNIQIIDFKIKPNVYMIAFDALVPEVLLKKYLEIETTPYHEVLNLNFSRFNNFFADRIPTLHSLNSLLALDIPHYSAAIQKGINEGFFSGLIPSPLFEVFKHNGYETSTLYESQYLGIYKGPNVDNYFHKTIGSDLRFGACEFIDVSGFKRLTFMGYCVMAKNAGFRRFLGTFGFEFSEENQILRTDFLLEKMREGIERDSPQVFVGYVFSPGHTSNTYDTNNSEEFDEYREKYIRAAERTAMEISQLVDFIAHEDPEAILYIFGDHGLYLSRSITFDEDSEFFVQDRFGVYGGIYPRERCREFFVSQYSEKYVTISQVAHIILSCLAGGKNAFKEPREYYLPESETKREKVRYEDYAYE